MYGSEKVNAGLPSATLIKYEASVNSMSGVNWVFCVLENRPL